MKPHKGRALDIFTEQSRDAGHTLEWQDLSSAHGFSLCLYVPMQDLSFRESTVLGADHIPWPVLITQAKNSESSAGHMAIQFAVRLLPGSPLCLNSDVKWENAYHVVILS